MERAKESFGATLGVVERALEGQDWLAGSFSLAEVSFMPELESVAALPQVGDVVTGGRTYTPGSSASVAAPAGSGCWPRSERRKAAFARKMAAR